MITKLESDLRREIDIDGVAHIVTLSPAGFVLTLKGRRKGLEIAWKDLVSGDAALATALNASLKANVGTLPVKNAAVIAPALPKDKARKTAGRKAAPGTGATKRTARR